MVEVSVGFCRNGAGNARNLVSCGESCGTRAAELAVGGTMLGLFESGGCCVAWWVRGWGEGRGAVSAGALHCRMWGAAAANREGV